MPFREAHLRRWQLVAGFVIFVLGVMFAVSIALRQGRHVDEVTCRQSTEGRAVLRDTLREQADFLEPLVEANPDPIKKTQGQQYLHLLRNRAHQLEEPPPCAKELNL